MYKIGIPEIYHQHAQLDCSDYKFQGRYMMDKIGKEVAEKALNNVLEERVRIFV